MKRSSEKGDSVLLFIERGKPECRGAHVDRNIDRMSASEVGRRVNLNLPAGPHGHVPPRVFGEHLHKIHANALPPMTRAVSYLLFERLTL